MKTLFLTLLFIPQFTYAFTLNNTAAAAFENEEVPVYVMDNCSNIGKTATEIMDLAMEEAEILTQSQHLA